MLEAGYILAQWNKITAQARLVLWIHDIQRRQAAQHADISRWPTLAVIGRARGHKKAAMKAAC